MDKYYEIVDYINSNVDKWEAVEMWNQIANEEDYLFRMEEFDMMYADLPPSKIVKLVRGEEFCECDDVFKETIYGVESGDVWDMVDVDELADYCIKHDTDLGCSAIREILDGEVK